MTSLNESILFFINGLAGKNNILDAVIIFNAVFLIYFVFAIASLLNLKALINKQYSKVFIFIISILLALFLFRIATLIYVNERPFVVYEINQLVDREPGRSFPSRHTTIAFALSIGSILLFNVKIGGFLICLSSIIAFSRIYVGLHHPVDILGAIIIAIITGIITKIIIKKTKRIH